MSGAVNIWEALDAAIAAKPRVPLATLPTPIDEAPGLSRRLGVHVVIKRDDLTGLALGGNKVRKLEFLIGDALQQGADCIVTTGGSQSNHARLTAAACRRHGLDCFLVLDLSIHPEDQGNLLLDRLLGAEVRLIESADPDVAIAEMHSLADELSGAGRRPYVIPRGGAVPAGSTGYAAFVSELLGQLREQRLDVTHLYLGTGSTGTHAGVVAGKAATGAGFAVQGVSVSRPVSLQAPKVLQLARDTLRHLGIGASVAEGDILVEDRFRGPGYGVPTAETMEAVEMAAREEALLLDPVYTGKMMAGLVAHAREVRFGPHDTVMFLHTGGAPALFAYHAETVDSLGAAL